MSRRHRQQRHVAKVAASASDIADLRSRLAVAKGTVGTLKYTAKDIIGGVGSTSTTGRRRRQIDEYDTRAMLLKKKTAAAAKKSVPANSLSFGARDSLGLARDLYPLAPDLTSHRKATEAAAEAAAAAVRRKPRFAVNFYGAKLDKLPDVYAHKKTRKHHTKGGRCVRQRDPCDFNRHAVWEFFDGDEGGGGEQWQAYDARAATQLESTFASGQVMAEVYIDGVRYDFDLSRVDGAFHCIQRVGFHRRIRVRRALRHSLPMVSTSYGFSADVGRAGGVAQGGGSAVKTVRERYNAGEFHSVEDAVYVRLFVRSFVCLFSCSFYLFDLSFIRLVVCCSRYTAE